MNVNSAVLEFNEGSHGINGVYGHFGFPGGMYTRTILKNVILAELLKATEIHWWLKKKEDSQSQQKRFSWKGERSRTKRKLCYYWWILDFQQ